MSLLVESSLIHNEAITYHVIVSFFFSHLMSNSTSSTNRPPQMKEDADIMNQADLTKRNLFGQYAATLASIAIFVNFAGVAVLGWAMFSVINPIYGFSFVMSPTIKAIIGFMGPAIGLSILRAQRKTAAAIYFLIIGILTIPPMIIGEPIVLDTIIAVWGILPFIPHVIGGILLVITAILIALWIPKPGSIGLEPITTTVEREFTRPEGTQPKCPICAHGLFGDEQYCPGCGHDLTKEQI